MEKKRFHESICIHVLGHHHLSSLFHDEDDVDDDHHYHCGA